MSAAARQIILASGSPYRKELLARLRLRFRCHNANIDETARPAETAAALVARLAETKARVAAAVYPAALIIGADQVAEFVGAEFAGEIIGKPRDHKDALRQLTRMSGQLVALRSGVVLYDAAADHMQCAVVSYAIQFRRFSAAQAERYLHTEQPYDCCGSLKAEGLGIALIEKMHGDDPTAIIGLPLIRLTTMLQAAGIAVV